MWKQLKHVSHFVVVNNVEKQPTCVVRISGKRCNKVYPGGSPNFWGNRSTSIILDIYFVHQSSSQCFRHVVFKISNLNQIV